MAQQLIYRCSDGPFYTAGRAKSLLLSRSIWAWGPTFSAAPSIITGACQTRRPQRAQREPD